MRNHLDKHFRLGANIDASDTTTWGDYVAAGDYYEGWEPVGSCSDCTDANAPIFSGSFDGANFSISNLYINRDEGQQAMFGATCIRNGSTRTCTESAEFIKNLTLSNVDITGNGSSASLVSTLGTTPLSNIQLSGTLSGTSCGGLAFDSWGDIDSVVSSLYIDCSNNPIGGIVALLRPGTISNVVVTGDIDGEGDTDGIAGYVQLDPTIINASVSGNVSNNRNGDWSVAGIVGSAGGSSTLSIINARMTGNVTAPNSVRVGGILGTGDSAGSTITIKNVYNTGTITGRQNVGGIVGNGTRTNLSHAFNTGDVLGSSSVNWAAAGGIVGANILSLTDAYSTASQVRARHNAGGIAGWAGYGSTYSRVYASSGTSNSPQYCTGGLIGSGLNGSSILEDSFAVNMTLSLASNGNNVHGEVVGCGDLSGTFTNNSYADITLSNSGSGSPINQASLANSESGEAYFQGPVDGSNSSGGEIYEDWDFLNTWSIENGELPKLRCPVDDPGTAGLDEEWPWNCSTWTSPQD